MEVSAWRPTRMSRRSRGKAAGRASLGFIERLLGEILEVIEPALAGADEVEIAVLVDVDGGHLEAGPGGTRGEILLGVPLRNVGGGIPGGLALEDDVAVPLLGALVEV